MICLDTNILPELLLVSRPKFGPVIEYLARLEEPIALSVLSTLPLLRVNRQAGITDSTAFRAIGQYRLLPMLSEDFDWARQNEADDDFQGALLLAAAIRESCTVFATTDSLRARRYGHLTDITIHLLG